MYNLLTFDSGSFNNSSNSNLEELVGGEKVELKSAEGKCSYCMVDDNKFIKYYFEPKNDEQCIQ